MPTILASKSTLLARPLITYCVTSELRLFNHTCVQHEPADRKRAGLQDSWLQLITVGGSQAQLQNRSE